VYEGGVRGVGFVNSPLLNRQGVDNEQLLYITDWFATILTLGIGHLSLLLTYEC
jgi:arylsulfatase B/arylsulfatase I/J